VPARRVEGGAPDRTFWIAAVIVAVLTVVVFSPVFRAGFTNWDDNYVVVENPAIRSLSPSSLGRIFSAPSEGTYSPLVLLSFALEYRLFGLHPLLFHLTNLLLHVFASLLVLGLLKQLVGPTVPAALGSLLFALHPLHVESVAWVTERKDCLFGLFFLAALLWYSRWLRRGERGRRWPTTLFFTLALLSKVQAATLPAALLLIDLAMRGRIRRRDVTSKIPLFILSGVFIAVNVAAQQTVGATAAQAQFAPLQRPLLVAYALVFYVVKTVLPVRLSPFYPYPHASAGTLPAVFYLALVGAAVLMGVVIVLIRRRHPLAPAVAFFLVTVAPALQIVPVGGAITADRFAYVPVFALSWIIAWLLARPGLGGTGHAAVRAAAIAGAGGAAVAFGLGVFSVAHVWQDSVSLWSRVITRFPGVAGAYNSRGLALGERGELARAITDFSAAIERDPVNADYYCNRGTAFLRGGEVGRAEADFRKAASVRPGFVLAHVNLGDVCARRGRFEEALKHYDRAVELDPTLPAVFERRASVRYRLGDLRGAGEDAREARRLEGETAHAGSRRARRPSSMGGP
jgi:tetratricopeptide (TPR) repeat protein